MVVIVQVSPIVRQAVVMLLVQKTVRSIVWAKVILVQTERVALMICIVVRVIDVDLKNNKGDEII